MKNLLINNEELKIKNDIKRQATSDKRQVMSCEQPTTNDQRHIYL